jgi:hypothetical protein
VNSEYLFTKRTTLLALVLVLAGCGDNLPIDVAYSMPLSKQPVTVLLQGLNQKAPGTVGVLGQLEVAENTRISKGSANGFELVRRNGLTEVADAPVTTAARMVSYGGGIIVNASDLDSGISKYDPTTKTFTALSDAQRGFVGVTVSDLQMPTALASSTAIPTISSPDVAYIGDVGCYAWYDLSGAVRYVVRNRNGSVLAGNVIITSGGTLTKIVALGTSWYVFWKEANAIRGAAISSTTYLPGAATTVVAAASCLAGTAYDIQSGFGASIALMYRIDATHHGRALVSSALVASGLVSDAVAADQPDLAMCWLTQRVFGGSLFYATLNAANGLKIQTINNATLAITATASQPAAGVGAAVISMTGGSTRSAADPNPFVLISRVISDATGVLRGLTDFANASTAAAYEPSGPLASRVAYLGTTAVVAILYVSTATVTVVAPQPYIRIMNLGSSLRGSMLPLAIAKAGLGGATLSGIPVLLTTLASDAAGALHGAFTRGDAAFTANGALGLAYGLADLTITQGPATVGAPLAFGGVALLPGGELWEIDNSPGYPAETNPAHEQGFRTHPEVPQLVEGAAASGSIVPGTRSYIVRWRWTDSSGQVYRSAPSAPIAITTANANSSVAVKVWTPTVGSLSRRFFQLEVLRTPNNGTGDEYFMVTPPFNTVDATNAVTTVFTDTASEATLAAGEPFDNSATAELDNVAPHALNDIIDHQERAFGVDAERPWRIPFSKKWTFGTSVAFTDAFFLDTPDSTGPVYKVMSMDGHLIAFKRDTIYVFSGDYPDADGTGAPIPSAVQLPVGVGTEQPRSVVLTDLGIIFYSSKRGFWLLNRSLGVDYIGAAVETTAQGQTVSGATVHPTYPEVRFTTEGGTTFVLNTLFTKIAGQPIWTTFTGQACVHSIVHQGDWYLLTAAGKLLKEDLTRWQDGVALGGGVFTAGTAFTRRVKVSDINFAGVGGFGRVYEGTLMGEWYASEKVKITITNNHRNIDPATGLPAAENPFTYDATIDPDPYMLDFYPAIQKVTAMDVQIEDTADFQTQGSAWTALNFIVGVKGGAYRQGVSHGMAGGARKF